MDIGETRVREERQAAIAGQEEGRRRIEARHDWNAKGSTT